jgi:hypothetical protein
MASRRASQAAGLQDFRFHDLRHTAASWMQMQGADIHCVAQILGHRDLRMAARYQHPTPGHLEDTVRSIDQLVPDDLRHHSVAAPLEATGESAEVVEMKWLPRESVPMARPNRYSEI